MSVPSGSRSSEAIPAETTPFAVVVVPFQSVTRERRRRKCCPPCRINAPSSTRTPSTLLTDGSGRDEEQPDVSVAVKQKEARENNRTLRQRSAFFRHAIKKAHARNRKNVAERKSRGDNHPTYARTETPEQKKRSDVPERKGLISIHTARSAFLLHVSRIRPRHHANICIRS